MMPGQAPPRTGPVLPFPRRSPAARSRSRPRSWHATGCHPHPALAAPAHRRRDGGVASDARGRLGRPRRAGPRRLRGGAGPGRRLPAHPRHHVRHRRAASRLPHPRRRAGRRGLDQQPHLRRHHRPGGADGRHPALPRCRARKLDARPRPAGSASLPAPHGVAGCRGWWCRSTCSASAATSMPSPRPASAGACRCCATAPRRSAPASAAGRPGAARGSPPSASTATRSSPPAAAARWPPTMPG